MATLWGWGTLGPQLDLVPQEGLYCLFVNIFAIDNHSHLVEIIIKKSNLFVNQLPTNKNRSKLRIKM